MSTTPECRVRTKQWKPLLERFWENVRKSDGCWLWKGYTNSTGYGQIYGNGMSYLAHRLSFEIAYGEIPVGLILCHKCDTRPCVNPEHLFAGTYTDNMSYMVSKGRQSRLQGADNPRAKLTENAVRAIRKFVAAGLPQAEIAESFNVASQTINNIVTGRRWKHLK